MATMQSRLYEDLDSNDNDDDDDVGCSFKGKINRFTDYKPIK